MELVEIHFKISICKAIDQVQPDNLSFKTLPHYKCYGRFKVSQINKMSLQKRCNSEQFIIYSTRPQLATIWESCYQSRNILISRRDKFYLRSCARIVRQKVGFLLCNVALPDRLSSFKISLLRFFS